MGTGDPPARFTAPFGDGIFSPHGRLAQRESAAFTRQRSLVRNQHRPPLNYLQIAGNYKPSVFGPGLFTATVLRRELRRLLQRFLQGLRGPLLHVGQEVGVDVQGDAYRSGAVAHGADQRG